MKRYVNAAFLYAVLAVYHCGLNLTPPCLWRGA